MKLSRLSMFYLAGYLLPSGLALVFAPQLVFRWFGSSHGAEYGDVIPRMAGGLAFALGLIVVQVIRHRLDVLHPVLVVARIWLVSVWVVLYVRTGDPFFAILAAIVAFGALLTAAGLWIDRKKM